MPPKKKLSKKEKQRLEAEQAELLRIENEKEKLKKLEEERQRKQVEREQAKRRQQQEIQENKQRRAQLKHSMSFFGVVHETIDGIKANERDQREWEKFMRCNGLPNANSPSDLRKYMHQWQSDIAQRELRSRNWLLRTDERTLLTHDANIADLSANALRRKQGNLGDLYARRIKEVMGILTELDEVLMDKNKPAHTLEDLTRLKTEVRVFLNDHLDECTYKTMSHIERDMEIDRPGVSRNVYASEVFKSHIWTFTKDAQISMSPKARIGEQSQHNEIDFPIVDMQVSMPPTVKLQSSALRGLWLNYDHFSDYCPSFNLKRPRPDNINILIQTKKEWHKRKEILQNMLDDCVKDSPLSLGHQEHDGSTASQQTRERSYDVDKLYTEYEDELNKARRRAIGPEAFGIVETDVNLRKYRIISGVYCIDYLETPQQDKRLNARSFIRTIISPDTLQRKSFYQTYKPPPPPQPGVRRLPEEIEAEMRMIEAALDKLALVTLQLPDSVIWFEPPIACRWETQFETLQSDLTEGVKPPTTATPTEATPLSMTTNTSPLKTSPRFPAKMRKRSSMKSAAPLPVREVTDFDMFNIPSDIDIYGLFRDFVVPRLPQGFCVRLEPTMSTSTRGGGQWLKLKQKLLKKNKQQPKPQKVLFLARHKSVSEARASELPPVEESIVSVVQSEVKCRNTRITKDYLDMDEPREFFPCVDFEKVLKFRDTPAAGTVRDKLDVKKSRKTSKNAMMMMSEEKVNKNDKEIGKVPNGNDKSANSCGSDSNSGGGSIKSSDTDSRRSSDGAKAVQVEKKTYMFSALLEDLDHLCELQMPLQEEALNQISANLTSSTSASGTRDADEEAPPDTEQAEELLQPTTTALEPISPFAYYTGISFLRDLVAKNGNEDKNVEAQATEEDESSSEYDEYDEDDEYYYGGEREERQKENSSTMAGNLNTLGSSSAGDGIHDFLSKHNQSDSDSAADGSKSKASHFGTLTQGKWSTRDVHDTKFNEDKLSIQFRTGRFGIFGFALNRYSNMPYQTWEIKPDFKSPGTILFSFTASIVSLDMTITSAGYCVNNFQGGNTKTIDDMIGKLLTLAELKSTLISSAVDIFPDEDAFCYTEGSCEKNYVMEMHTYACISTLAQSHNFSWSRWNLLAGSRTAVLLIRELIEGKKVPYHSTLLVTPLKTAIIDCTEVSASFNSVGVAGMEYYADLYQLSQVHALPSSLEKQRNMEPLLRDNVARILMAIRPLSFC